MSKIIIGIILGLCLGFEVDNINLNIEPEKKSDTISHINATLNWAMNDYYISQLPKDALHPVSLTECGLGRYQTEIGVEHYYYPSFDVIEKVAEYCGFDGSLWVRDDGVVMCGDYVVIAADKPYGTVLPTSLGKGIVLDTGWFDDVNTLDIATVWW